MGKPAAPVSKAPAASTAEPPAEGGVAAAPIPEPTPTAPSADSSFQEVPLRQLKDVEWGDTGVRDEWSAEEILPAEDKSQKVEVRNKKDVQLMVDGQGGEYGYRDTILLPVDLGPKYEDPNERYMLVPRPIQSRDLRRYRNYDVDIPRGKILSDLGPILQTPDPQIFRYGENGPYILRESIFTDSCNHSDLAGESYRMSEDLARAVAWFVDRRSDDAFCRVPDSGTVVLAVRYKLKTPIAILAILTALDKIESCQDGESTDDPAFAALCSRVDPQEIEDFRQKIKDDLEAAQETGDGFFALPFWQQGLYTIGGTAMTSVTGLALTYSIAWGFALYNDPPATIARTFQRYHLFEEAAFRFRTDPFLREQMWRSIRTFSYNRYLYFRDLLRGRRGGPWDGPPDPPTGGAGANAPQLTAAPLQIDVPSEETPAAEFSATPTFTFEDATSYPEPNSVGALFFVMPPQIPSLPTLPNWLSLPNWATTQYSLAPAGFLFEVSPEAPATQNVVMRSAAPNAAVRALHPKGTFAEPVNTKAVSLKGTDPLLTEVAPSGRGLSLGVKVGATFLLADVAREPVYQYFNVKQDTRDGIDAGFTAVGIGSFLYSPVAVSALVPGYYAGAGFGDDLADVITDNIPLDAKDKALVHSTSQKAGAAVVTGTGILAYTTGVGAAPIAIAGSTGLRLHDVMEGDLDAMNKAGIMFRTKEEFEQNASDADKALLAKIEKSLDYYLNDSRWPEPGANLSAHKMQMALALLQNPKYTAVVRQAAPYMLTKVMWCYDRNMRPLPLGARNSMELAYNAADTLAESSIGLWNWATNSKHNTNVDVGSESERRARNLAEFGDDLQAIADHLQSVMDGSALLASQ